MVLQDTPANHTLMDAVVGSLLVATQLGTVFVSHLKGKRGQKAQSEGMDKKLTSLGNDLRTAINVRCDDLSREVSEVSGDVRDLKAYVIGPDGQNGLRGDVRVLKEDVRGLLDREMPRTRRKR